MLYQGLLRTFLLQALFRQGLLPRGLGLLLLLLLRWQEKKTELRNVPEVQAEAEAEAEPEAAAQTINAAETLNAAQTVNAAKVLSAAETVPHEQGATAVLLGEEAEAEEEAEQEQEVQAVPPAQSPEAQISSSCSKTCQRWKRGRFGAGL